MDAGVPVIRVLPPEVAGQIRSSSVVTNLNGVILELLKNSLDANAFTVTINVDFQKGTCSVEDDGQGIPPTEFSENGGLGKLHYTSKFYVPNEVYGRKGIFLSSLISMALVTITSRNGSFQSTNSIIFRHSKPISRLCPAPIYHGLLHPQHGTRVTVNDLFSNLPVRAKRRAQELRRNEDVDREWNDLKRALTGLLLAFQTPVKLSVVDASKSRKLVFRGQPQAPLSRQQILKDEGQRLFDLERVRSILGQAGYIAPCDFPLWVATSARSSDILVEAAISLQPSPTKQVQFISSGINPVYSRGDANLLFSEINQLFALSNFGVEDSFKGVSGDIEGKPIGDMKASSDSPDRKPRPRSKGVNKWPMFYLRITTDRANPAYNLDSEFSNPRVSIQKVLRVISAMIRQFLDQYHFSPRRTQRPKRNRQESSLTSENEQQERCQTKRLHQEDRCVRTGTSSPPIISKSAAATISPLVSKTLPFRNFGVWSRVKSGSGRAYHDICAGLPRGKSQPTCQTDSMLGGAQPSRPSSAAANPMNIGPGGFQTPFDIPNTPKVIGVNSGHEHDIFDETQDPTDEIVPWTDPLTKRVIYINKRTGQTVTAKNSKYIKRISRSASTPQTIKDIQSLNCEGKGQIQTENSEWLDSFLETWKNPTFPSPELPIPSTVSRAGSAETWRAGAIVDTHCLSCEGLQNGALTGLIGGFDGRLSKDALSKAKVIAQVDNKFILLSTFLKRDEQQDEEVLVLVDQHAADERCRVEELFAGLCGLSASHVVDTTTFAKPMTFRLSTQEAKLFETRSGYFASWGCRYEVLREAEGRYHLVINSLPTLIAERCRMEPKLAIDMLRSEIWEQTDIAKGPAKLVLDDTKDTDQRPSEKGSSAKAWGEAKSRHYWLERVGSCPRKMADLIVSRSCRSAIMFNDTLSIMECESLVAKLANCAFPFQCAHGRPSMIPIINLGTRISFDSTCNPSQLSSSFDDARGTNPPDGRQAEPCSDFVTAFNKWQNGPP
ncbi:DNA mismatch repair protein [Arthroderma uncinatum]|uniref:DNA mismatch repair protein n=1 Tax=Arthroderma uncinatum TaxID=74035 RepID=UPI00144A5211|nr:DNA mismatch repair protein [Arthroderma uncinatum]KAF3491979.1 DNA mismatch repair protein [Arthroderma uncinatum]